MKKTILAVIALAALAAACHNQKQDPNAVDATRARSNDAHQTLDQQVVPQP